MVNIKVNKQIGSGDSSKTFIVAIEESLYKLKLNKISWLNK